jgi:propionyl-CoA carboxylase alpha chain
VDTALEEGVEIGIHYDPLLAKIVSYGLDRETALRKLVYALRSTAVLGLQTNREYLIQILESAEFREGRAHTGFLPAPRVEPEEDSLLLAATVLYLERTRTGLLPGVPPSYRNNPYRDPSMKLRLHGNDVQVQWKSFGNNSYAVTCGAHTLACRAHSEPGQITLEANGIARAYQVKEAGDQIFVQWPTGSAAIQRLLRHPRPASASQRETANSPMPGQVLRILVQEGQQVKTGDALVVLEAMKMEQTIRTTINGVVQSILVVTGQVVAPGQKLVQISAPEDEHE